MITLHPIGYDEIKREFDLRPTQIGRAARLTINQITNELHRELGKEIPKYHGTSIAGFKRVRAKKKLAKANRKRLEGITWIGRNAIAAVYAGKPRKVKNGVKVGRYLFENAFILKMKSGHIGVFRRIHGTRKIKEVLVELTDAKAQTIRAAKGKRSKIRQILQNQLRKQIKRRK